MHKYILQISFLYLYKTKFNIILVIWIGYKDINIYNIGLGTLGIILIGNEELV